MSINEQLFAQARKILPGGNTRTTLFVPPAAPYAAHGTGSRVVDEDGYETIDCNNNYTALIHGHCFRPTMDAATAAISRGTAFGLPTRYEIELAEVLTDRLPGAEQWRFCNSGTEAIMQALRIARAATNRDLVIRFANSYHGTSDAVVDPSAPGVPESVSKSVITIPVGDAEAFEAALAQYSSRLAAVLVDLMPNRAGLHPLEPAFVQQLRRRTQDVGALMIIDEVITFRTRYSGMQSLYGVAPDLTTVGKIIGGGFPVGAVGGTSNVMEVADPRRTGHVAWGGTFSANPVSMAAGRAALQAFEGTAIDELNRKGDRLRDVLGQSGFHYSGAGSLTRIFPKDMTSFWWKAYTAGIILGTNGLLALSTAMTDEDITLIGERLKSAAAS